MGFWKDLNLKSWLFHLHFCVKFFLSVKTTSEILSASKCLTIVSKTLNKVYFFTRKYIFWSDGLIHCEIVFFLHFQVSLAVADTITLVSSVPQEILSYHILGHRWVWGPVGCTLMIYLQYLGIDASGKNILFLNIKKNYFHCLFLNLEKPTFHLKQLK